MSIYSQMLEKAVLPSVGLVTGARFWDFYREFGKADGIHLPARESELAQNRITDLMAHAYTNVPFYRDRMRAHGIGPALFGDASALQRMPKTTKADIASSFPELITDSAEKHKPWRFRSTSGTIDRLTVVHDSRKRDVARAADLFALRSAAAYRAGLKCLDIPPDVCRNVCGAGNEQEPGLLGYAVRNLGRLFTPEVVSDLRGLSERQLVFRRLELASFPSGSAVQENSFYEGCLRSVETWRPFVLRALPVYLYMLASYLRDSGRKLAFRPSTIMPIGGSVSPHIKTVVEQAFGARVAEAYGSAELGSIGAECEHRRGIHPFSSAFRVEVIREGRSALPGELGDVLVTDFFNYAMPFIRYDIGDVAVVRNGNCGCGAPAHRIELHGRRADCLIDATGDLISPDAVTDAVLKQPGVRIFQLEMQDPRTVDLQIVPDRDAAADLQDVGAALTQLLKRSDLRIAMRLVPTIMAEPNGKFRLVKNSWHVKQQRFT